MLEKIYKHPWVVAATNMLFIMFLYTLQRLFFYYINSDIFPNIDVHHLLELLGGGLRFDLTALLYLNSVYLAMLILPFRIRGNERYQSVAKGLFVVTNTIGIIINSIDMVYFRFTDRRTTCRFFTEFENDGNLANIFFQGVVQYWYVSLFAIVIILLLICFTRKEVKISALRPLWLYYLTESLLFVVSVYFVVIGIRGGFGKYTRPITISNAMQYVNTPNETAIVLNTPFSLMKSLENSAYINPRYFEEDELNEIFTPIHLSGERTASNEQAKSADERNVVVFILESFSKEYIGYFNQDLESGVETGFTPFLDSLLQYSRTYGLSFASGRKSIDAMPSTLSSIPMLIEPYIVTPYSTNAISSLADCLKKKGYSSAFFHGAPNGSMGFQAFARSAGFEKYYGMDEYDGEEAFDGTWAIWDEEFLQYYARTMSQIKEPFITAVFTASSHHPFRVPERYEGQFSKGSLPIHQCIGYSDNAIRQFFNYAKTQEWYDHTLFVFTADHTNQLVSDKYNTSKGVYEIPIFFYAPDNSLQGRSNCLISQPDIMPSVLEYLGYDYDYFAFGKDKLSYKPENDYVVNYNHPLYQVISDSLLVQFDGQNVYAVYDFLVDPLLEENRKEDMEQRSEVQDMVSYLKAYIQQYVGRMIDNKLTVDN